jgi:vacuolar-type H+-ATPase subunit F/Vma7
MPHSAILFHNRSVVAVEPIQADSFETIEKFKELAEEQDLPVIVVTQEAWNKYDSLISRPEKQ